MHVKLVSPRVPVVPWLDQIEDPTATFPQSNEEELLKCLRVAMRPKEQDLCPSALFLGQWVNFLLVVLSTETRGATDCQVCEELKRFSHRGQ